MKLKQAVYQTEFKSMVISMLKGLCFNYKELSGNYTSMKKDIETMNKNQLEMKNAESEIKQRIESAFWKTR